MKRKLILGTRGSKMALVQTQKVAGALTNHYPDLITETKVITTKGDRNMAPIPLDTVGKDWFTKELEIALTNGEIDLAVHSLKDLAPETPPGLTVAAVLTRDDPRDALVPREPGVKLADLRPGAVIGTDSLRRKANLLRLRPDLVVRSVRGNVQTRLRKLHEGDYDALVLAAAGLERLELLDAISEWFAVGEFVPAIGQGALAAEARTGDTEVWTMIHALQDPATLATVAAEQAFSQAIGGGCKLPVGCYADLRDGRATIHGLLGSDDATKTIIQSVTGPATQAEQLARKLAANLKRTLGQPQ